jgi:cob(I)alamin adenosyltransferase
MPKAAIIAFMPHSFTGNGDDGSTGLLGEGRVPKDHPRVRLCGELDEASACLGLARAVSRNEDARLVLSTAQRDLYGAMAEVASLPENAARFRTVDSTRVAWLEDVIRRWEAFIAMPEGFILPGDCLGSAAAAMARTVVRRAERGAAALTLAGDLENPDLIRYLNRLSSLCFVLELLENREAGVDRPTPARPPSS